MCPFVSILPHYIIQMILLSNVAVHIIAYDLDRPALQLPSIYLRCLLLVCKSLRAWYLFFSARLYVSIHVSVVCSCQLMTISIAAAPIANCDLPLLLVTNWTFATLIWVSYIPGRHFVFSTWSHDLIRYFRPSRDHRENIPTPSDQHSRWVTLPFRHFIHRWPQT